MKPKIIVLEKSKSNFEYHKCARSKGQLISKANCQAVNSSKKRTKEFVFKSQIISECPYEKIVCPKIATKKFLRFLPWPLRRGEIKKIKALYYTN